MNRKNKIDVFSKVEQEAKKKLNNIETKGAAQTVLDYIEKQRSLTNINAKYTN